MSLQSRDWLKKLLDGEKKKFKSLVTTRTLMASSSQRETHNFSSTDRFSGSVFGILRSKKYKQEWNLPTTHYPTREIYKMKSKEKNIVGSIFLEKRNVNSSTNKKGQRRNFLTSVSVQMIASGNRKKPVVGLCRNKKISLGCKGERKYFLRHEN